MKVKLIELLRTWAFLTGILINLFLLIAYLGYGYAVDTIGVVIILISAAFDAAAMMGLVALVIRL